MQVGMAKVTTRLCLVLRLRICGVLPAFHLLSSGMMPNYTQGQLHVVTHYKFRM